MKFSKEFKEALKHLPNKEKDRLVMRLLKKDRILAERLYFELLDNRSVDDRREEMEERVIERSQDMAKHFYSPGYLMMDLRYLSGDITEHVKTTKDKFGEASLNLTMLIEVLKIANPKIEELPAGKSRKLCVYIIARAFKIMVLLHKLHPDLLMEVEDSLTELGMLIGANDKLMRTAIPHGLDVNWLIQAEIPEDIAEMQKELRANGFLK